MAQTVHLFLRANGSDIQGESTIASLDRENSIECFSYTDSVDAPVDPRSGLPSGRHTLGTIMIRKAIDKSTPLLHQALAKNEVIEATFKFYRPNPTGDGTTQHYYSVELTNARLGAIARVSPNTLDPATANQPGMEDVSFSTQSAVVRYESTGAEYSDTIRLNRAGAL